MTYGWILGEVARRVDGRPFPQLLEEEICRPLGIKTMFAGIPEELDPPVAIIEKHIIPQEPIDDGRPRSVPASLGSAV